LASLTPFLFFADVDLALAVGALDLVALRLNGRSGSTTAFALTAGHCHFSLSAHLQVLLRGFAII